MATNYADDLFVNISDDGMTEDLWNLVKDDVYKLKSLNATSDKDRNLLFYLEHFIDDLLNEFGTSVKNKKRVIGFAFNSLRKEVNIDLTDIRHAVLLALRKNDKLAYPNIQGVGNGNMKPQRNITKWIKALGEVYAAMNNGDNKDKAIIRITEGWDPMEKLDFLSWARYYENDDHEKYQLTRTAAPYQMPTIPQPPTDEEKDEDLENSPVRGPGRPRKTRKTLEQAKTSLISRLDSASRLLREFATVWPPDVWNRLAQALSDLKREVIPMKTVATMHDRVIRTASIWDKNGFSEGADLLRKFAQPPDDVTTQIEKALTGKEYDTKKTPESAEMGGMDMPPMDMSPTDMSPTDMPPMDEIPPEAEGTMPPAGVEEEMPPPEMPPLEELKDESSKEKEIMSVEEEENPFKNATIQDALDVLEPLEQKLSEREFSHSLSKADMILDSLNIASHFPELAEAQSKALELNLYVLSRLKSIISKLKGGVKEDNKDEKEKAPQIEMEELKQTKQNPIDKKMEKEMFEVNE